MTPPPAETVKLDPIALLVHASAPIRLTVAALTLAGAGGRIIVVLNS